jgi:preprotein translocase subunit SecY
MLQAFADTLKIPDLRKKLLITFAVIAVFRLGTFIPTPGIDGSKLAQFFENLARTWAVVYLALQSFRWRH